MSMNSIQKIAKNTTVLLLSNISNLIFGSLYVIYMARFLGAKDFGALSFAMAITGILSIFFDLGLQQLTIREAARNNALANKYLNNILALKIFLSIFASTILVSIMIMLDYSYATIKIVCLITLSTIFISFTNIVNSIFQAFEKMEYVSVGTIANNLFLFILVVYGINNEFSTFNFATIFPVVSLFILAYSFLMIILYFFRPNIQFDYCFLYGVLKNALPFALSSLFMAIYFNVSLIMLTSMKGDEAVGLYNASYRLVFALLFIPSAFFSSIYPLMSTFYENKKDSLKFGYFQSFRYMMIIALPIGVGTTILADKIILLLYGVDFVPSIIVLRILIWSVVFSYLSNAHMYLLYSMNKQNIFTKIVLLCSAINIALNLLFIPKISYVGASISTFITEFVLFLLLFIYTFKYVFDISILCKSFGKLIIIALMMGAYIIYFGDKMEVAVSILSSVILYILLFWVLKGFSEDDVLLIKTLLRRPN